MSSSPLIPFLVFFLAPMTCFSGSFSVIDMPGIMEDKLKWSESLKLMNKWFAGDGTNHTSYTFDEISDVESTISNPKAKIAVAVWKKTISFPQVWLTS